MARRITQRELRNESGEIMRALGRGETFVVTRNGVPVGELMPLRRRQFVSVEAALAMFGGAPVIDAERFLGRRRRVGRPGRYPTWLSDPTGVDSSTRPS